MNTGIKKLQGVEKKLTINNDMDDYIENILAENLTLKRKLESKCEALVILNKEIASYKSERDYLKNMVEDLKHRQPTITAEPEIPNPECTRALRLEIDTLRQKLRDALGDVQALRSRVNQSRSSSMCDGGTNLAREEELIEQIEQLQRKKSQLEADLQALLDEKEELVTERDAYKCKLHRLNHECNVLLRGNASGIIDLDALVMENRFLQERLLQAQEENLLAKQVSERYKNMLQQKRQNSKGSTNGGSAETNLGMLLSQKQVKELLENCGTTEIPGPETSPSDLRSLCLALLDSLGDKTLALSHQKRANRILAARIAELQGRLESLQTAQKQAVISPSAALLEGYHFSDRSELMSSSSTDSSISNIESQSPGFDKAEEESTLQAVLQNFHSTTVAAQPTT